MPFVHELSVRYADTDAQGHTFFANYLTFCDEALTYFLVHLDCDYASMEHQEQAMFVYAHSSCNHLGRTFFADRLRVEVTPERIGQTSFTTLHRIIRPDGTLAAEGRLVSVCVHTETRQKQPLPDRLRHALTAMQH